MTGRKAIPASAAPHPVYGGVKDQCALGLDLPEDLRVGEGELHIVVAVKTDVDLRLHVLIDQVKAVGGIVAVHAAERVHNIERIGVQPVHHLHQAQQLNVRIKNSPHRLHEDTVSLFHDDVGPVDRLGDLIMMKGQSDAADPLAVIRGENIRVQLLFPDRDHRHKHRLACPRGENLRDLRHTPKQGALAVLHHSCQEAALNDIDPGAVEFVQDGGDRPPPKVPVVDISPVAQGAVENLNAHSTISPFSIFSPITARTWSRSFGVSTERVSARTGIICSLLPCSTKRSSLMSSMRSFSPRSVCAKKRSASAV